MEGSDPVGLHVMNRRPPGDGDTSGEAEHAEQQQGGHDFS